MDNKTQKMNIALSLTAFAVVIVVVCAVGIYTFRHREAEIVQGQAEASEYRVSSKVPGRILKILVHEGQTVHAGDTLAILDTPDINAKQAQAEAVLSAATAQNAKRSEERRVGKEKTYNRVENLYSEGVVSEQKRDEAKAQYDAAVATEKAAKSQYDMAVNGAEEEVKEMAAAQMRQAQGVVAEVNSYIDETVLTASLDGEVSEIFPMVGELVGTGAPIMNIAVMDDMWVSFNVREDLLQDLTMDAVREAYVPALDKTIEVKVSYMRDLGSYAAWKATKVNGQYDLKTFEVRAIPQQKVENLRPGMTVIIDRN